MDAAKIKSALADVTTERDPTLKSAKMASLCSTLWAERGVELVVVGGSAIKIAGGVSAFRQNLNGRTTDHDKLHTTFRPKRAA